MKITKYHRFIIDLKIEKSSQTRASRKPKSQKRVGELSSDMGLLPLNSQNFSVLEAL